MTHCLYGLNSLICALFYRPMAQRAICMNAMKMEPSDASSNQPMMFSDTQFSRKACESPQEGYHKVSPHFRCLMPLSEYKAGISHRTFRNALGAEGCVQLYPRKTRSLRCISGILRTFDVARSSDLWKSRSCRAHDEVWIKRPYSALHRRFGLNLTIWRLFDFLVPLWPYLSVAAASRHLPGCPATHRIVSDTI